MYEVFYATTRIARIAAADPETAKRRFAAYVLYDDFDHVESDVQLSFGDAAELTPVDPVVPGLGSAADVRASFARGDIDAESFEVNLYEHPERTLDPYLRLLAMNDPWRLEGHSSLGRLLSSVPMVANLITLDDRISYLFDASSFLDYIRLDVLTALDPHRPQDSIRVESLVDVAALRDDGLRQIVSAYETIALECRLTAKFCNRPTVQRGFERNFEVTFDVESWTQYIAHRVEDPARFLPPPGWTSAFPTYDGEG